MAGGSAEVALRGVHETTALVRVDCILLTLSLKKLAKSSARLTGESYLGRIGSL